MAELRSKQAADVRQLNGAVGEWAPGRTDCSGPSPQRAAQSWDFVNASAGRPATPAVDSGSHGWRHAQAPAAQQQPASQQQQQQQRQAGTPGSHATPPASRGGTGLLRAMRTSSNSLSGLLKRPGTVAHSRSGSPGGSPLFEVRGAAMLPPEPARPATSSAGNQSAPLQRPSTVAGHQQLKAQAGGSPLAFSVEARAGHRSPSSVASGSSRVAAQQAARHAPAVVASHGLDLGTSPPSPALSLAQQLEAVAAARRQHKEQQQPAQGAHAPAAAAPPVHDRSASSSSSQASVYGAPSSSSSSGGSRRASAAHAAPSRCAPFSSATMHSNPLYSAGSEAYGRPRQRPAHPAPQQPPAGTPYHHQQQQQPRAPPPVRVSPPAATSVPQTPMAGAALLSSSTPGPSPPCGALQAASNLTIASDGRPISPGPFLSTLASSALPDTASARTHSRPVSPQCVDSVPPTPGSFAPLGGAAAAAARAGSNLSPIKAVAAAASRSHSLPSSPAPPSAAGSAVAAAAAAGASPSASGSAAATAFRLPIFNQDGRLVGYKQNSNLIPRPGACISSAPSSPARSGLLSAEGFAQPSGDSASIPPSVPKPVAAPAPPPGDSGDFAEYLADPCRGFPDADNMVPGYVLGPVLGKGGFCSVRRALHELTGQTVACKIIEKGKLKDPKDRDRVDRECRVMRNLSNHVAVVKLFEYVETRDCVYIMMEAAKRGSLLDYVRDRKKLPESEAVIIFQQLLHALQFCHRKDVVHRDIKLENILIDSAGHMKLIDFGLCGYFVAGKRLRCHCGSPSYAAPEIVARKDYLGPPVDVWSLGVVLFAMLAGYLPFHAKEKKQLSEKILAGVYKPAAWMSSSAQDLISRMLTLDPEQRITLEAVWAHPWVASAPRWEPQGVGTGRLYRALTDPTSGAVLPDDAVLAQLEQLGADVAAIRRALRSRECNSLTASYHLMLESKPEAQRAAAAHERSAAADRVAAGAAAARGRAPATASAAGDWQWDFASISAAVGAAAASGSGAVGSHASAGSSSLRGSGSPARLRPATASAVPGGSPTRFGQEAAAAGYFASPRRLATAGPQHAAPAHAARVGEWDIKAVRPPALHAPAAAGTAAVLEPAACAMAAAAAAELTPPAGLTPIILATSVVAGDSPTGAGKSPALSPLPTALSPKQLTLVPAGGSSAGAGGSGSSGCEHSPPIAQAV
ncbi:hypothetical protein ABPG77_011090 [Micractinium sp. CCAP 211/92]